MDTPGLDPEKDLNALERRLSPLNPVTGRLNRDRMLFEAGRASARATVRGRLLAGACALLAITVVTLGGLFALERTRRHELEVALAARDRDRGSSKGLSTFPVALTSVSASPYSYRELSRRVQAAELEEWESADMTDPPGRTRRDPEPAPLPVRVRAPGGTTDF